MIKIVLSHIFYALYTVMILSQMRKKETDARGVWVFNDYFESTINSDTKNFP